MLSGRKRDMSTAVRASVEAQMFAVNPGQTLRLHQVTGPRDGSRDGPIGLWILTRILVWPLLTPRKLGNGSGCVGCSIQRTNENDDIPSQKH